jgi:geranylgeranyl diphosphate synthase type II
LKIERLDIDAEIRKLDWNREPKGLYEPIGYALAAGGKRIRPKLALLGALAVGRNEKDVLPAALALEVFHNFTLLHDDVMDKAEVRRGRPTVHVKWNENTAILSGDQMMIEAYKLLSRVPEDKLPKVLRMFNKMATEICEGQQLDVDFEQRNDVTIAEYMEMIRLKTSVLLATALQIGAYIANGTDEEQQALYDYGINLGLAFQIQDDYLDCFGDPETFGKAIGGDIREGKKTWLWLTAHATGSETAALLDHCAGNVEEVLRMYEETGVKKAAEEEIARLTKKAMACLEVLKENKATKALKTLAEKLAARNK